MRQVPAWRLSVKLTEDVIAALSTDERRLPQRLVEQAAEAKTE